MLYLFIAIGLIIASAITLQFGDDFFTNGANTGTSGSGTTPGTDEDNGEEGAIPLDAVRRNALTASKVVSSVGVASVSFYPSKYLSWCPDSFKRACLL